MNIPPRIIISFIEANFTSHKITSSGEYRINSPFISDKKYHFYINPEKGVVNDFKSGYSGSFVQFARDFLDIPATGLIQYIISQYGGRGAGNIYGSQNTTFQNNEKMGDAPAGVSFFSIKKEGVIRNIAYNYLVNRGIPEKNIEELGYIYDEDSEYNKMIFIPFFEHGDIVYFICRDFAGDNYLRYKNPVGLNSKQFVYNIDKMKEDGTVFIFEGIFDALSLDGQIGTAMLSSDFGKEQVIKILNTAPETVVFVPDNDEAGKKSLDRNVKLFLKYKPTSLDINILVYNIENVKDFNETGKHHISLNECEKYKRVIIDETKFRRKSII